jgi:hypothetical protein
VVSHVQTTNIDDRIEHVVDRIRTYRDEAEELDTRIQGLKAELRDLLERRGENWSDESGYARLVSEGERVSYNASDLDELIIQDPLHYGWLKDYRTTSTVQSRVQVK